MNRYVVAFFAVLALLLVTITAGLYLSAVTSGNMHEAVMRSDFADVNRLLAHGYDINQRNRGTVLGVRIRRYPLDYENEVTPLYVAVSQTNPQLVSHLLDSGADPTLGGGYETPLHLALICLQPSIDTHDITNQPSFDRDAGLAVVRSLIAHGADPNFRRFEHSETPLEMSDRLGQDEARELMLQTAKK